MGRPTLTSLALRSSNLDKSILHEFVLSECILTITQEKHIITTHLTGRNGTVKEYINDGDYNIDVVAGITHPSEDDYPYEELEKFMHFLKTSSSIEVQSDFLTLFGIDSVVVKSYHIEQETYSNRQTFSMTLLSEESYEIKLKSKNE